MDIDRIPALFKEHFAAWLRIEPRCRQDDFASGLQARTADPLWMLTRQWQTGEFSGEDAGSPIKVSLKYSVQEVNSIKLGGQNHAGLPPDVPLETLVEQEQDQLDYRERVRIGQEFERRLRAAWRASGRNDAEGVISELRACETVGFPAVTDTPPEELDRETRRFIRFMRGRVVDGLAVIEGIDGAPQDIADVCEKVRDWYASVIHRPSEKSSAAWQPEKLDYCFEVNAGASSSDLAAGESTRLIASDYRNGELDWYSFSAGPQGAAGTWVPVQGSGQVSVDTTPTRITITGTSPRWWAFEDGQTAFGAIDVGKPDLLKLLLMEFVLVYGDDWFSVPAAVPLGSLVRVDELKVSNVFGESTTIDPARVVYPPDVEWDEESGPDFRPGVLPEGARFDLFTLSGSSSGLASLDVRVPVTAELPILVRPGAAASAVPGSRPVLSESTPRLIREGSASRSASGLREYAAPQLMQSWLSAPHPILLIPPSAGYRQESAPLDEVRFLRDEGANMIWAVEHTVANGLGKPVSGFDAQLERSRRRAEQLEKLRFRLERLLAYGEFNDKARQVMEKALSDLQGHIESLSPYARPAGGQGEIPEYRLASYVPENWIPFIPAASGAGKAGGFTDIHFRRAKMLRNSDHSRLEGDSPFTLVQFLELQRMLEEDPSPGSEAVLPILQSCLVEDGGHPFSPDDGIPSLSRLLALDEYALMSFREETVPRAGLWVQLTRQRARWTDGSTHVWLGRKVRVGRGEGSSGLRFDTVSGGKE